MPRRNDVSGPAGLSVSVREGCADTRGQGKIVTPISGSKKPRWRGHKIKPVVLVIASVMSFGGLVAATAGGSQAQPSRSNDAAPTNNGSTLRNHARGVRVCDPEYPYPGCSSSQIANLEAGTKKRVKRSYKAMRWGQKRHDFKKAGPRVNRIPKRAFRHAKDRYQREHPNQRLIIGSWRKFRANLATGGCPSFGRVSIGFWCHYDSFFGETIVDHTARVIGRGAEVCWCRASHVRRHRNWR